MEHYATKIIACCITLGICLILPIGGLIFYAQKHRGEGIVSAWIVGALGFRVSSLPGLWAHWAFSCPRCSSGCPFSQPCPQMPDS